MGVRARAINTLNENFRNEMDNAVSIERRFAAMEALVLVTIPIWRHGMTAEEARSVRNYNHGFCYG